MNGPCAPFLSAMKGQYILWSLKGDSCAHLDLLRLASAAAAWRSWVDLLTGTPNTALWVTSLRMRLWPLFGAAFGEEGGVSEPALWIARLLIYIIRKTFKKKEGNMRKCPFGQQGELEKRSETETGKRKLATSIGRENLLGKKILSFSENPTRERTTEMTRK